MPLRQIIPRTYLPSRELQYGTDIKDSEGNNLGKSKVCELIYMYMHYKKT